MNLKSEEILVPFVNTEDCTKVNIVNNMGRKDRLRKWNIISNIILIIVFLIIGIYIFYNFELFKILGSDVCKMCAEKTGAVCYKLPELRR